MDIFPETPGGQNNRRAAETCTDEGGGGGVWRGVLALRDTDLISKTPPLLLGRLDICSLGVGIAFIARLRGGTPHSALSHTHCDLRERDEEEEARTDGWTGRERWQEREGREKKKKSKNREAKLYRGQKKQKKKVEAGWMESNGGGVVEKKSRTEEKKKHDNQT